MYLDRWPAVEGCGDIVPLATVGSEQGNEFVILLFGPRSSFDLRVKSLSPSLE